MIDLATDSVADLACELYRAKFHRNLVERIEELAERYPVVSVSNPFNNFNNEAEIVTELGKLSRNQIARLHRNLVAASPAAVETR